MPRRAHGVGVVLALLHIKINAFEPLEVPDLQFDVAKGGDVELEIRHLEQLKHVDLDERKEADDVRSPRHAVLSPRSSRDGFS